MRLSLTALLFLICSTSFDQTNSYQNLLDTALNRSGCLFVHSKPLQVTRLDKREMRDYVENLRDWSKQTLDTAMFSQIIQNAKFADTTLWADSELPKSLIVHERGETVSKEYALQKLGLTNDEQTKLYKKQINKFNSTETVDRSLCYFSRPVFDNSKTFAVVQWDNGHSYLGGGGGIVLYQFQSDTWKEVGIITNWRY
jgi:hypothetical protein